MAIWKTEFHRSNFNYSVPIRETYDVVFEVEWDEVTDENESDFWNASWNSLQSLGLSNSKTYHGYGFSSMLPSRKYERIAIPHCERGIDLPSDGKPVIGSIIESGTDMMGNPRRYRVTELYKMEKITDIWYMVKCLSNEATIVSGSGVCGIIDLISNVRVLDEMVKWDDTQIKQEQGKWFDEVSKQTFDSIMMLNWSVCEVRKRLVEEMGLDKV